MKASVAAIVALWMTIASAGGANVFLKPEQAFKYSLQVHEERVVVIWEIEPGYYLYRNRLSFSSPSKAVVLGKQDWPAGEPHEDEFFGEQEVYRGSAIFTLPFQVIGDLPAAIPIEIKLQGCADRGLCFPPVIWRGSAAVSVGGVNEIEAALKESEPLDIVASGLPKAVSEQTQLSELVRNGSLVVVLATFFGFGLLLSLTPCVLPMIPILAGIIVGTKGVNSPRRGLALAMTYVQGMALTYAVAGAVSVVALGQAPQAFFQKPWIISVFATLFVLLALAMFGSFNLQLPSSWQTKV